MRMANRDKLLIAGVVLLLCCIPLYWLKSSTARPAPGQKPARKNATTAASAHAGDTLPQERRDRERTDGFQQPTGPDADSIASRRTRNAKTNKPGSKTTGEEHTQQNQKSGNQFTGARFVPDP